MFLAAAASLPLMLRPAWAGTFTVVDGRADNEISEISRLYVDEQLAATIRLDATVPQHSVRVETAAGRVNHTYALCGEITIRTPDGRTETHEVNGGGILHRPEGRTLSALGTQNFTEFYLADPDDPTVVERQPGRSSVCSVPTS